VKHAPSGFALQVMVVALVALVFGVAMLSGVPLYS